MEKLNIILSNDVEKEVDCMFYLYNSKYYFIYTEKEVDENGYVVLYLSQVGKEIKNTPNGPIETGYMVGVEISDDEEWKSVQSSVAKIVEDAKNGTQSQEIQILPLSMISKLKIVSKKTFRLMKEIVVDNLHVDILNNQLNTPDVSVQITQPVIPEPINPVELDTPTPLSEISQPSLFADDQASQISISEPIQSGAEMEENNVIIDYRAKFFEEQEKNSQLQQQIDELNSKLEQLKNILN